MTPPEAETLRALLRGARTIAVVGLSPNPMRPSNSVARYLRRSGYKIVPVNPGHGEILDEKSYRPGFGHFKRKKAAAGAK